MTTQWLRDIEQKVEAAAKDLTSLRRSEKLLKSKVRRLEKELKATQEEGRAGHQWSKNQALIRTRVEKLIDGLERLDNS
jgi:hypothetical protein